jgi:hypothetical protein
MVSPGNQSRQSQLAASKLGARLWRMNIGLGWVGDAKKYDNAATVQVFAGDVVIRHARPFKSGVEGMSDGVGLVPVIITPEMVGTRVAVFLAVEDKQGTGRPSPEQSAFIKAIRALGGRAGIARGDEDVAKIVRGEICD